MGGDTGIERQLARSRVAIGYAVAKRQACAPWLVSTSRALPPDIRCISRGCNRGMTAVSAGNHRRKQRPTRERIILYSSKGMDNDIKSPVVPMYSMMGNSCRRRLGIMYRVLPTRYISRSGSTSSNRIGSPSTMSVKALRSPYNAVQGRGNTSMSTCTHVESVSSCAIRVAQSLSM